MVKKQEMNQDMDTRTPRDRVTGDFLRRLEAEETARLHEDDGKEGMRSFRDPRGGIRTSPVFSSNAEHLRETRGMTPEPAERLRGEENGTEHPHHRHLAMVYAPEQFFGDLYDTDEGFVHGTIFRELDYPFYPTKCKENGGACR